MKSDYNQCSPAVNDICIHPSQGELISCDQAGSIKQWDLTENICTLELVRRPFFKNNLFKNHPLQAPAGNVPIRSVTIASDGQILVAGNNKVYPHSTKTIAFYTYLIS